MSRSAPTDRPYHHGQLREALLDAAVELLVTHKASQISLRAVARQAGVSHAAPYHYFADRNRLLSALAERCFQMFYAAQQEATTTQTDPTEQLIALGEAYVQFALQHPNAYSLIFDPEYCGPQNSSTALHSLIQANQELLTQTIKAVQATGHLPNHNQNSDLLAPALWGTVHGLAQLILLGHLPPEITAATLRALLYAAL